MCEFYTITGTILNFHSDLRSVTGILDNLFYLTPKRKLLYVTDTYHNKPSHKLEHLSCFLPGLLALGAHTLDLSLTERERHMWAAEGLAYTCWIVYAEMMSGIAADEVSMHPWPGKDLEEGLETGRWREHIQAWEKAGRHGVPPGLDKVKRVTNTDEREYSIRRDEYYLRPEVRATRHFVSFITDICDDPLDRRELFLLMEDDWEGGVAGSWVGCI
jgi:mannosyl-oligosaccharide alpha-1,2-mannosidase